MSEPKAFTVENLIADEEATRAALSPARLTKGVNSSLSKLSLLSSRVEYWDCFVCAIGFARDRSIDVNELLIQTARDFGKEAVGQTREFLDYCTAFTSIPENSLSAAAAVIVNGGITADPKLLMDYETCYEMCGDNNDCLKDCLYPKTPKI